MMLEPRERVAESSPTFWEESPPAPATREISPDDAYSTFVNLAEEELLSYPLPDRD